MLSVVVYGRNDSHGYNLHKRAAISLNCIAELLCGLEDEIVFVDYNSPNMFPTFPEAIKDTLTLRARKLLRVIRVRPDVHLRYAGRTHLPVLEPIARNIGIRRSRPNNRWILSTNSDIVMVPQRSASLNDIARDLAPGIWQAPRIEIPETLWESLDRADPAENITTVRSWGRQLHIDEIVFANPNILYDGPGDFQLMEREALFRIDGFNEAMLLGWHADSNLAVRMSMYYGRISDLGEDVYAYHCDHTRQITSSHNHDRKQNSYVDFVDMVKHADLPRQKAEWGLPEVEFEELRLIDEEAATFADVVRSTVRAPLEQPYRVAYSASAFNQTDYDPRHVLPFLLDVFRNYPRNLRLGWCGCRPSAFELFSEAWRRLGFTSEILKIDSDGDVSGKLGRDDDRFDIVGRMYELCDAFVFDFSDPSSSVEGRRILKSFNRICAQGTKKTNENSTPKLFVGLNAINNSQESYFCARVASAALPFSSRLRYGHAKEFRQYRTNLLALCFPGDAGERRGDAIVTKDRSVGLMCYGPYIYLPPGRYSAELRLANLSLSAAFFEAGHPIVAAVEILSNGEIFYVGSIEVDDLKGGRHAFDFTISEESTDYLQYAVEFRIFAFGQSALRLDEIIVERDEAPPPLRDSRSPILATCDWLKFMRLGPNARRFRKGIVGGVGAPGHHLAFGPYWRLPPGSYEALLRLRHKPKSGGALLLFSAVANGALLGTTAIHPIDVDDQLVSLRFEVDKASYERREFSVELPIFYEGDGAVTLHSLIVNEIEASQLSASRQLSVQFFLQAKSSGYRNGASVGVRHGDCGVFAEVDVHLSTGHFALEATLAPSLTPIPPETPIGAVELARGDGAKVRKVFLARDLGGATSFHFFNDVERACRVLLWATGAGAITIDEMSLRRSSSQLTENVHGLETFSRRSGVNEEPLPPYFGNREDWLPELSLSPASKFAKGRVVAASALEVVAYGPYRRLPVGNYAAVIELRPHGAADGRVRIEIVEDLRTIAETTREGPKWREALALPFHILAAAGDPLRSGRLEVRFTNLTAVPFVIQKVEISAL